jgi:hypothetical protein
MRDARRTHVEWPSVGIWPPSGNIVPGTWWWRGRAPRRVPRCLGTAFDCTSGSVQSRGLAPACAIMRRGRPELRASRKIFGVLRCCFLESKAGNLRMMCSTATGSGCELAGALRHRFVMGLGVFFLMGGGLGAQSVTVAVGEAGAVGEPWYFEAALEPEPRLQKLDALPMRDQGEGANFYDHGNPTAHEQLMLELINRARANPGVEAARLGIDLNQGLAPGTIADTFKQPLAMHPQLIGAARGHSQWMLDNNVFDHTGEGGSSPQERMQSAGYPFTGTWTSGENIAWGGTSGPLDPLEYTRSNHDNLFLSSGHRVNLMNGNFEEIGIGIFEGPFNGYNALMTTQNFARSGGTPSPFAVGVVYYDFNSNGVYDVGEGIGGVQVDVSGSTYYTFTADAGGYALPIPSGAAGRTVTLSGPGFALEQNHGFSGDGNGKVDFALAYTPPAVQGPPSVLAGNEREYQMDQVPGAGAFRIEVARRDIPPLDAAEDLALVVDGTSSAYSALGTAHTYAGGHAYRLAHTGIGIETLTYAQNFHVGAAAELAFRSRLGWAAGDQVARVEVSLDNGSSWTALFTQAGNNGTENQFYLRIVDLSAYAGQSVRLRFSYAFAGGIYYPYNSGASGWYLDNIEFHGMRREVLVDSGEIAAGEAFGFEPEATGELWLRAVPRHQGADWPPGPWRMVEVAAEQTYAQWADDQEWVLGLAPGLLADDAAGDTNADGVSNFLAFAMALPVAQPAAHLLPAVESQSGAFHLDYRKSLHAGGVVLAPQISSNLTDWFDLGAPGAPVGFGESRVQSHADHEIWRVTLPSPAESGDAWFVRVRALVP